MELTVYSILLCLCKNKNKSSLVLTIDKQLTSKDNSNQTSIIVTFTLHQIILLYIIRNLSKI